jgi:threonine dehydrogenase-like Zn-dependent dehydrogenase
MGHEFVGEIVEMGSAVKTLQMGDRVVTAFTTRNMCNSLNNIAISTGLCVK